LASPCAGTARNRDMNQSRVSAFRHSNETLLEWSGAARGEHLLTRAAIVSVPICSEAAALQRQAGFYVKSFSAIQGKPALGSAGHSSSLEPRGVASPGHRTRRRLVARFKRPRFREPRDTHQPSSVSRIEVPAIQQRKNKADRRPKSNAEKTSRTSLFGTWLQRLTDLRHCAQSCS
jgi:hypothetical protein